MAALGATLPGEGNPLNLLGRLFMWLMSWLAYAY
jgi:hypothetical protein